MKITDKRRVFADLKDFEHGDIVLDNDGNYYRILFLPDHEMFGLEDLKAGAIVAKNDAIPNMLYCSTSFPLVRIKDEDVEMVIENEKNSNAVKDKESFNVNEYSPAGDVYKYYDDYGYPQYGMILRITPDKYAFTGLPLTGQGGIVTTNGFEYVKRISDFNDTAYGILENLEANWDHVERIGFYEAIDDMKMAGYK